MAAQQAQFAETIRAMKLALKRKADGESHSYTLTRSDTIVAIVPSILIDRKQTPTVMRHSSNLTRIAVANI